MILDDIADGTANHLGYVTLELEVAERDELVRLARIGADHESLAHSLVVILERLANPDTWPLNHVATYGTMLRVTVREPTVPSGYVAEGRIDTLAGIAKLNADLAPTGIHIEIAP